MSPNRFSVSSTSTRAGSATSRIAAKSTYRCSSLTAGNSSAPTRVTVSRQSSDTSSTFALSTDVSRPRRSAAARNATRATRSISAAV